MDGTLKYLTAVELLARGSTLHEAGDILSAEADYMQILQDQPNHPEANHNLAILLSLQGNLEGALDHLKICLNANPNVNLFWATYIDILIKLGRISDAKTLLISAKDNGLWHSSMQKFEEYIVSLHLKPSEIEVHTLANSPEVCSSLYGESWSTPVRKGDEYTVRTADGRPELVLVNNSMPTPSVHGQTDQKKLPIRVVCATKFLASDFFSSTLTGRSLHAFSNDNPIDHIQIEIADNNIRGLSSVYNQAIEAATSDPAILVFIHDDIMITDFFWTERVRSGLENFDVVGLAGCQDRKPYQPNWFFSEYISPGQLIKGDLLRSGAVAHGEEPFAPISNFGPTLVECKLMDGLFLAVNSETLVRANVRFDDDFKFHFYDMDFCRSVEKANLKMGTIPLSVVHKSGGNFATGSWSAAYQKYIEKWND